jgi:hypothetical protein
MALTPVINAYLTGLFLAILSPRPLRSFRTEIDLFPSRDFIGSAAI